MREFSDDVIFGYAMLDRHREEERKIERDRARGMGDTHIKGEREISCVCEFKNLCKAVRGALIKAPPLPPPPYVSGHQADFWADI